MWGHQVWKKKTKNMWNMLSKSFFSDPFYYIYKQKTLHILYLSNKFVYKPQKVNNSLIFCSLSYATHIWMNLKTCQIIRFRLRTIHRHMVLFDLTLVPIHGIHQWIQWIQWIVSLQKTNTAHVHVIQESTGTWDRWKYLQLLDPSFSESLLTIQLQS